MTGSRAGSLLLLCVLAAPAAAQRPDGSDTRPEATPPPVMAPAAPAPASAPAPAPAPALPNIVLDGTLSGPINRPHVAPVHAVYGGEVTFDADQADGDLKDKRYTLSGHVRLHETDTTIRAGEVTFNGARHDGVATDALLTQGLYTLRSARIEGTPGLLTAYDADVTTVPPDQTPDFHVRAQTITLDAKAHRGVLRNATLYLFGARLLTIPKVTFHLRGSGGASAAAGGRADLRRLGPVWDLRWPSTAACTSARSRSNTACCCRHARRCRRR